MDKKYDVIVIGAGNGGLFAAATCAKEGLKTLLLEKHNIPGGCATSFRRGRFEFEPSLHELCGGGTEAKPGDVIQKFQEIGAKVNWCTDETCFRVILKGKDGFDAEIKCGSEKAFVDSIEKAVPGSKESVSKLFRLEETIDAALLSMEGKEVPNILELLTKYSDFVKAGCHSTEDILNALGMPKKAQDIINTYWGYLGVPTDDLNAMHFLSMVTSYVFNLPTVPHDRSHELSLAICDTIYKNGGEIWYNSPVTNLLFEGDKVVGVETNGQKIYAKEVISNAMPNNIYNMIGNKAPEKDRKLTNARELGMSMVAVYMGLDASPEELGIKDYTLFITSDPDPRKQYNLGADGFYIVNCLNVIVPDCSPKGTSIVSFTMPLFDKDFPKDLKVEEYKKWKNEFALKYIKDYEKVMGIDILSHIEEVSIATPVTFARYLNTPQGAIYGYQNLGWDNVLVRTVFDNIGLDNTIKGLSFVGGHSFRGDGYSSAYTTGYVIGKRIAARIKGEGKNNG